MGWLQGSRGSSSGGGSSRAHKHSSALETSSKGLDADYKNALRGPQQGKDESQHLGRPSVNLTPRIDFCNPWVTLSDPCHTFSRGPCPCVLAADSGGQQRGKVLWAAHLGIPVGVREALCCVGRAGEQGAGAGVPHRRPPQAVHCMHAGGDWLFTQSPGLLEGVPSLQFMVARDGAGCRPLVGQYWADTNSLALGARMSLTLPNLWSSSSTWGTGGKDDTSSRFLPFLITVIRTGNVESRPCMLGPRGMLTCTTCRRDSCSYRHAGGCQLVFSRVFYCSYTLAENRDHADWGFTIFSIPSSVQSPFPRATGCGIVSSNWSSKAPMSPAPSGVC